MDAGGAIASRLARLPSVRSVFDAPRHGPEPPAPQPDSGNTTTSALDPGPNLVRAPTRQTGLLVAPRPKLLIKRGLDIVGSAALLVGMSPALLGQNQFPVELT